MSSWGSSWGEDKVLVEAVRTAEVTTMLSASIIDTPSTADIIETTSVSLAVQALTAEIIDLTETNYDYP